MTIILIALLSLVIIAIVTFSIAGNAKNKHVEYKRRLYQKTIEQAQQELLDRVRLLPKEWTIKGDLAKALINTPPDAISLEYHPSSLKIGGDFLMPKSMPDKFNKFKTIGALGNDEICWIGIDVESGNVIEFDETQQKDNDRSITVFPSIFHYLLYVSDEIT